MGHGQTNYQLNLNKLEHIMQKLKLILNTTLFIVASFATSAYTAEKTEAPSSTSAQKVSPFACSPLPFCEGETEQQSPSIFDALLFESQQDEAAEQE